VLNSLAHRIEGDGDPTETPIGRVPAVGAIDTSGLDVDEATMAKLVAVDPESWRQELPQIDEHYRFIGDSVPTALREQLDGLEKRLAAG
jgi:phosphoenolpyruvate carboxykinase (GTP)